MPDDRDLLLMEPGINFAPKKTYFKQCVAVYAVLERNGQVFCLKRSGTGYMDGFFGLPAGKVDEGEDIETAALRELEEEAGVSAERGQLHLAHLMHRFEPAAQDTKYWIDIYFRVTAWHGDPVNAEPHKASEAKWIGLDELDKFPVQPYVVHALTRMKDSVLHSGYGWK